MLDQLAEWREAGCGMRAGVLQILDLVDREHLELIAAEVRVRL